MVIRKCCIFLSLIFVTQSIFASERAYEPISDRVRKKMNRYSPRVGRCYLNRKKEDPQVEARFAVEFDLSPLGKVMNLSLTGMRKKDLLLEECIKKELMSGEFPPSRNNKWMRVRYQYLFSSK